MHKALKAAVADGLIPRNAVAGLKLPRITREEIDPLTEEQARRLLETVRDDRLEALYVLALNTGMRQGELLALKWDDVDLGAACCACDARSPTRTRPTSSGNRRRTRAGAPSG